MSWLGRLVPEGRFKHSLRLRKARAISSFPEGPLKLKMRLRQFGQKPDVDIAYLINPGDTATLIGCMNSPKIERMSHCVGPSGRVIIVEPDKNNLAKHNAIIEERRLENVTVIPKAVFDRKGKAQFLVAPIPEDHRIAIDEIEHDNDYREPDYYIDAIDIEVDTIDNIMRELNVSHLGFIEIMINGAEMHALRSMEEMLPNTERMFVKGHARDKETKTPLREEIIPFLESRGFQTRRTVSSPSIANTIDWGERTGDVFAWRER